MFAGHVQDLPALLGRQAAPDVPRRQRETDGPEASAEARPHETILAQALAFTPFVVAALAIAVVVAVVFLAVGLRLRGRRG